MKSEIESIKERNERVEVDKSWEISKTRRAIIGLMTYLTIVLFLFIIDAPNPWFTSLVPTIGFLLSTLTLPFFKKIWISKIYKK
jgi:polyferredoxin